VPAKLIGAFAAAGDHSMMITTESAAGETAIRIGNTGAEQSLPLLATACRKLKRRSAPLDERRAGGLASAKYAHLRCCKINRKHGQGVRG